MTVSDVAEDDLWLSGFFQWRFQWEIYESVFTVLF